MKPLSREVKQIVDRANRWVSIDTAPKDGTKIMVRADFDTPTRLGLAHWTGNHWLTEQFGEWLPIPDMTVLKYWLPLPEYSPPGLEKIRSCGTLHQIDEHLPTGSPAHWLKPGEFQVWCPRVYGRPIDRCGFMAPVCAVSGLAAEMGCDRCGGPLRVAEVSLDGVRTDREI